MTLNRGAEIRPFQPTACKKMNERDIFITFVKHFLRKKACKDRRLITHLPYLLLQIGEFGFRRRRGNKWLSIKLGFSSKKRLFLTN